MDYAAKMVEHLTKVEELDHLIDSWDRWAREKVLQEKGSSLEKLSSDRRDEMIIYETKKILNGRAKYGTRVGSRNHNLSMAKMYALAALVQFKEAERLGLVGTVDHRESR